MLEFILQVLAAILLIYEAIAHYSTKKKLDELEETIVELRDKKPATDTPQARAMQFANELEKTGAIKEEGDEIVLKVLK